MDNLLASAQLRAELARIQQDEHQISAAMPDGQAVGFAQGGQASQGFAHDLQRVLRQVDGKEQSAADRVAAVESGQSDDLVGAMLASQDASLSFSMLMQVRNKVVGAVDELIKLQL